MRPFYIYVEAEKVKSKHGNIYSLKKKEKEKAKHGYIYIYLFSPQTWATTFQRYLTDVFFLLNYIYHHNFFFNFKKIKLRYNLNFVIDVEANCMLMVHMETTDIQFAFDSLSLSLIH